VVVAASRLFAQSFVFDFVSRYQAFLVFILILVRTLDVLTWIIQSFQFTCFDEVVTAVKALAVQSCNLDPLPSMTLKAVIYDLVPFLTVLFNRSLSTGCVPAIFKAAYISPCLKKVDMDPTDVRSHRPISNLSVISKLLERLVARQLLAHLISTGLLPRLKLAYRTNHSTETAVLKFLSDILLAIVTGDLSALVLDLSAAFNTVDYGILLQRLDSSYKVVGLPKFYLSNRLKHILFSSSSSSPSTMACGIPQGSVHGTILFLLYCGVW